MNRLYNLYTRTNSFDLLYMVVLLSPSLSFYLPHLSLSPLSLSHILSPSPLSLPHLLSLPLSFTFSLSLSLPPLSPPLPLAIHHSVDVYPPPLPIPGIPMEPPFPQYSPIHPLRPAQQMQRGLLPHPSPGLLQPTTAIPPHPPPPGSYIMFRPPHHPHSTTYH